MAKLDKIGKYEILAKIGEGGFGIVYKGKDPFIKRLVAVKTCSSENESIQKRFFREAEIAGNLHHANVVTIHDFGVDGETPYLVQEFLTGEDLDVLITNPDHVLTLPTKVRYLRGIAEGLRYAHAQGVIHRDIKPANIRILENNRVKVMDFGIAKLRDQESQLTQTGMALGTVAYMSPEQLKGESVDHRVDIFSFGVLAYELVVGQRPFQAETVSTLFYLLLHENPPAITDPEVPKALVEVIEKCLAKSLDVRYGSFDEVLSDLEAVQEMVGDGDEAITADPFSTDPTSTLTRLAAKAARSINAGDLTAAEVTLDLARKECDPATFDREFGPLARTIEEKRATRTTGHPGIPGIDIESQIQRIDSQLQAGKIDTAAVAFTALEMQFPSDPRVADLRTRVSQAVHLPPPTGATPSPPSVTTTPLGSEATQMVQTAAPAVGGASRARTRTGPLVAAAAAVLLLLVVGSILAFRYLSRDPTGSNGLPPAEPGPASPTEPAGSSGTGDEPSNPTGADQPGGNSSTDTPQASDQPTQTAGGSDQPAGGETRPTPSGGSNSQSGSNAANGSRPSTPGADRPDNGGRQPSGGSSTRPDNGKSSSPPSGGSQSSTQSGDRGNTSTPTRPGGNSSSTADRPKPPEPKPITPTTIEPEPRDTPQQDDTQPQSSTPSDQGTAEPPATPPTKPVETFDPVRYQTLADLRATLDAYRDAWISRDADVINRYYPGENVSKREVKQFKTIAADVVCGNDAFDIRDNAATASCTITIVKNPGRNDSETVKYTRAELVKQGTRWVITSLAR